LALYLLELGDKDPLNETTSHLKRDLLDSLESQRSAALELLSGIGQTEGFARRDMDPREGAYLQWVVSQATKSQVPTVRKQRLLAAIDDPLGYHFASRLLADLKDVATERLETLDAALARLQGRPGRGPGGVLDGLVSDLIEIWKTATGKRVTYTKGSKDTATFVTGETAGAFPTFCRAAIKCLPEERRPPDHLLVSTIRRLVDQSTK
jgi:hypothetical protein